MGNKMAGRPLSDGLFGKTRQAVLALLYGRADTSFYTKQVLDAVRIGRGAVQRELKNLTETGIVVREVQGRRVYYRANNATPIFDDLRNIVEQTAAASPAVGETPPSTIRETATPYVPSKTEKGAPRIAVPKRKLAAFCRRNHIRRLSLFGSVLREDFRPDSDVDVLVEFDPGKTPGFAFFGIQEELSNMLGRKVDLNTLGDISPYFRDRVAREATTLYDAG